MPEYVVVLTLGGLSKWFSADSTEQIVDIYRAHSAFTAFDVYQRALKESSSGLGLRVERMGSGDLRRILGVEVDRLLPSPQTTRLESLVHRLLLGAALLIENLLRHLPHSENAEDPPVGGSTAEELRLTGDVS